MGIYMHQHRLPRKGRGAGICLKYYCECGAFTVSGEDQGQRTVGGDVAGGAEGILNGKDAEQHHEKSSD